MRRVVSYGGSSGVPGSQRLKHKLSLTPGLHLISGTSVVEGGFLAAVEEPQDERIIHRTSGATRNFYATASFLKKVAKREPWVSRKDPFAPVVQERTIFDEPVQTYCNGKGSSILKEEVDGEITSGLRVDDSDARGDVDTALEVDLVAPHTNAQILEEASVEKTVGTAFSLDRMTDAADSTTVDTDNDVPQESDILKSGIVSDVINSLADLIQRKEYKKLEDTVVMLQSLGRRNQALKKDEEFLRAVVVLQKSWRRVKSVQLVKRLKTEKAVRKKHNAAIVVQKHWRAVRSRQLLNCLKEEQKVLAQQRIDHAVVVLQKHWRAFQSRRVVKVKKLECMLNKQRVVDNATIVLQKLWRAQQGRQLVKLLRLEQVQREQQKINRAATVLQSHWRAKQGRRLVRLLRMEHIEMEQQRIDHAATVLQAHWRAQQSRCLVKNLRMEQIATEKVKNNDAAVVLQKHWRAFLSRRLAKEKRVEFFCREQRRIDNAALVLQKYWRAQQSRGVLGRLKENRALMDQQKIDGAAVLVQKHWRARQGRNLVNQQKMEEVLREQQRIDHAATVLQAHWRAQKSRYLVNALKKEQVTRKQETIDHAALLLQTHWQGKHCRYSVNHLKKEQIAMEQQRTDHAAIVLQKHWRALQSRSLVELLRMEQVANLRQQNNHAAIVLQKLWRGRQSLLLLKRMKLELALTGQQKVDVAATTFQKCWRAQQSRLLVKHLKMERAVREQQIRENAASIVQKHWRAHQSRVLAKNMKGEQLVREQHRIDDAAVVLQKYWRARQSRHAMMHLKMNLVIREQLRVDMAATMFQKHWRGQQSRLFVKLLRSEQDLREQQRVNKAAIILQKQWRARRCRILAKHLKMELVLRGQHRIDNAAIVFQKHWRAQQSRLLVRHMKKEQAVREQYRRNFAANILQKHWRALQSRHAVKNARRDQVTREQKRIDRSALVLQKHWRARQSRCLARHLKLEQAARNQQRVDWAVTVIQKYWRGGQNGYMSKCLRMQQAGEERAAVCIEAHARENNSRVEVKAALVIQKAWQRHWSSRLNASVVSIQRAFRSYSDIKRKTQATVVLQAYARGFGIRRRLGQMAKSSSFSVQRDHTCKKILSEAGVVAVTDIDIFSIESSLHASDAAGCLFEAENYLDSCQDVLCHEHSDVEVHSGDQSVGGMPVSFAQEHSLSVSKPMDENFSETTAGELLVQKNGSREDWNFVAVDHLEECLDTCLAVLRPLPPTIPTCLAARYGLDVPDEPQKISMVDQSAKVIKIDDRVSNPTDISTSMHGMLRKVPDKSFDIGESGNEPNNCIWSTSDTPKVKLDEVTPAAIPSGATDHLDICSWQTTDVQQFENSVQSKSLYRQTLKHNEHRLKQFAQVFLLQRHISLQQQRAQAAPPFPPSLSSASGFNSNMFSQLEVENGDTEQVAGQSTITITNDNPSQIAGGGPVEHHLNCEIVDPDGETASRDQSVRRQNSGGYTKQVIDGPGPDVVLDMVVLLRRIEEEHGTSEADFEAESSTWCSSGCGDIEEGIPLLERNLSAVRSQSSVVKFSNGVSMKHISIPDLNAVLLVLIAMVLYTRTICQGLFFGARQTHRRT